MTTAMRITAAKKAPMDSVRTTALGFAAARVLEAAMIFTGATSLLSLLTLQRTWAQRPGRIRPRS